MPNPEAEESQGDASRFRKALSAVMKALRDRGAHLTVALVGQTGSGKSSTANSLLGLKPGDANYLEEGRFEPTTQTVEVRDLMLGDVPVKIVDTPGLCDDLEAAGNDDRYLSQLKDACEKVDCLLYVSKLDSTRIGRSEMQAIRVIDKALGRRIWKHVVMVFTHADRVEPAQYKDQFRGREASFRKELVRALSTEDVQDISFVALSNKMEVLPDGSNGLNELWVTAFERCSVRGSFLMTQAPASVDPGTFSAVQQQRVESRWSVLWKWLSEEFWPFVKDIAKAALPALLQILLHKAGVGGNPKGRPRTK